MKIVELQGHLCSYQKKFEPTKEIQQFANIHRYELPNSKRTIIPSLQPISPKEKMILQKSSSILFEKQKQQQKTKPKKNAFIVSNTTKDNNNNNKNDNDNININSNKKVSNILKETFQRKDNKRLLKPNELHKKYVQISQINNIPGPEIVKRKESNYKEGTDKNNKYKRKIKRDYNSKISCLPTNNINKNNNNGNINSNDEIVKEESNKTIERNTNKNESHFTIEDNNNNNNFNSDPNYNTSNNSYDIKSIIDKELQVSKKKEFYDTIDNNGYSYNKSNNNKANISNNKSQRLMSFSGKKIRRDRNAESKESLRYNPLRYEDNKNPENKGMYYEFAPSNDNRKYYLMKNISQFSFG